MEVDPITMALVGGLAGGTARGIFGYLNKGRTEEFDYIKFARTVAVSAFAGLLLVWTIMSLPGATLTFWGAFFIAFAGGPGVDVLLKDFYKLKDLGKIKEAITAK